VRKHCAVVIAFVLLVMILGVSSPAVADAGVFTGNGQSLHQISSKNVQLVSIDVVIVPGRGRFLFDGSVPGMDQADYICTFVLRSLSENEEDVQIGFPVDSQFAREAGKDPAAISPKESSEWVQSYSFIARDEKSTYHVEFVRRKPAGGPGEFGEVFTWNMHFAPKETRMLTVQYRMPITMGLASTIKNEGAEHAFNAPLEQELLNFAMEEVVGYITSTGSSWAGNVEEATFTVITEPFETYLNVRGLGEQPPAGLGAEQDEDAKKFQESFPVIHPWWFRQVKPDGWKKVEHGVQWSYTDYKPQDSLVIVYSMTNFPQLPDEVDPFVDRFLKNLSDSSSSISDRQRLNQLLQAPGRKEQENHTALQPAVELRRLKQLLLATYGKEPEDAVVKEHVAGQIWYEPKKDFSMESLSKTQKAVLKKLDGRIAAATTK
jgi:hypothetical protein